MPTVRVLYQYTCELCGDVYQEEYDIPIRGGCRGELPFHAFPPGWREVGNMLLCTNHAVRYIIDDGKRVIEEPAVTMNSRMGIVDA